MNRDRLSIDVSPQEHRQIKVYAAMHGKTIRQYIIDSVKTRLAQEAEDKFLENLTKNFSNNEVLKEVWDNEKDFAYDRL